MTQNGWFQIGLYLFVIFLLTKPIGVFMTRVFNREKTFLDAVLRPIEKLVYRLTGVNEKHEMRWTEYAVAMLLFSGVSMTVLYLIERTQKWLPFNPQKFPQRRSGIGIRHGGVVHDKHQLAGYSGESTMSYLTQMAGLAYHNFVSAAVGIVLAIVVIRGIARKETDKLGNFWVDTTRCPSMGAAARVSGGFADPGVRRCRAESQALYDRRSNQPYTAQVTGTDGKTTTQTITQQVIAQGPVASQEGDQGIRHQRRWIL